MLVKGSDFEAQINDLADPDSLEKKFGGTLDDKENEFYPPTFK